MAVATEIIPPVNDTEVTVPPEPVADNVPVKKLTPEAVLIRADLCDVYHRPRPGVNDIETS